MQQASASATSGQPAAQFVEISFGTHRPDGMMRRPFSPPVEDLRRAPRRRVLLSALIVNAEFNTIFRCRVKDVSEQGARLQIPEGYLLPKTFWLIAMSAGLAYEAKTMWRRYPNIGVSVGEAIDLDDPPTRLGKRLRMVWQSVAR